MEALRQSGHAEDTLVIYTSDHGELLGDHGFWTKMAMYEGSVAVPMIINGPDIPQGQNRDDAVHLLDIPATAMALAGLEQPADWPGVDLMTTAQSAPNHDRSLFSDAINAMAFRDQQKRIEDFGGVEACLSAPAFNATPTPI